MPRNPAEPPGADRDVVRVAMLLAPALLAGAAVFALTVSAALTTGFSTGAWAWLPAPRMLPLAAQVVTHPGLPAAALIDPWQNGISGHELAFYVYAITVIRQRRQRFLRQRVKHRLGQPVVEDFQDRRAHVAKTRCFPADPRQFGIIVVRLPAQRRGQRVQPRDEILFGRAGEPSDCVERDHDVRRRFAGRPLMHREGESAQLRGDISNDSPTAGSTPASSSSNTST